jgi:hypothetical protein
LVAVIASRGAAWAWALLALNIVLRILLNVTVGRSVLEERDSSHILLLPLRIVLEPVVWAASWLGNTVSWRGEKFRLRKRKLQANA